MIYLVRMTGTDFYKIGHTSNVQKRICSLQTGCPTQLIVIITSSGCQKKEKEIQDFFNDHKVRKNGEWFKFSNDIILKKVCDKIKNPYSDNSEELQKHHEDLIKDKIEKYLIEDIIVTSKGSEFYISFGKLKETPIKKRIRIQKRVAINKIKKSNKNGANEEYNAKQREWYKWRKRAKKAGIPSLKNRRPTPTERKEWQNLIIQAEI